MSNPNVSNLVSVLLTAVIAVVFVMEWRYRARRDGRKEATQAMIFAAAAFFVGYSAQTVFGLPGLFIICLLFFFVVLALLIVRQAKAKKKVRRRVLQADHDYYVKLRTALHGDLSDAEWARYKLAMEREKAGEVDPLPVSAE